MFSPIYSIVLFWILIYLFDRQKFKLNNGLFVIIAIIYTYRLGLKRNNNSQ